MITFVLFVRGRSSYRFRHVCSDGDDDLMLKTCPLPRGRVGMVLHSRKFVEVLLPILPLLPVIPASRSITSESQSMEDYL